jgi:hypothetical protein
MGKVLMLDKETLEFTEVELNGNKVSYELMRSCVEGYVNRELDKNHIDVWCNEEGKLENLKPSCVVLDENHQVIEILAGNLLFTSRDNSGNSTSLFPYHINLIKELMRSKVQIKTVNQETNEVLIETVRILPYK